MLADTHLKGETPARLDAAAEQLRPLFSETLRIFDSAHRVVPDGFTRARYFWPIPIYIERGAGAHAVDVDGREYIDCLLGFGVMIAGHCHPHVVEAVQTQLAKGTQFGTASRAESQLAETIVTHVPGAERVIFVNSGTEATLAAIRLARAATGRRLVAKFEGGWHGQNDYTQHNFHEIEGPPEHPVTVPATLGIPASVIADTVVLPYNDPAAIPLIDQYGSELAAVIIEGVQGGAGSFPGEPEFLREVARACNSAGAVLIMDEVITGFRMGPSGISGKLGITPDLITLGKVIGGGLPIGAVAGRAKLLDTVIPNGDGRHVVLAGTFSANPLSLTAGKATLELLLGPEDVYSHLDAMGERMRSGLTQVLSTAGVSGHVTGTGSLWGLHLLTDAPPRNVRESKGFFGTGGLPLTGYLLREGILMEAPIHLGFLSIKHTPELVDRVLEAHASALTHMQRDGFF